MELTTDLIAIQGILCSKIKHVGEFTKINYRGGNEEKILDIMTEIHKYLMNKNYIQKREVNPIFHKELDDIVFFLALNTTYKKQLVMDEYAHLMNIVPPLSKCLFANVVYGLDLFDFFALTIERLPIEIGSELLDEAVQCLKKSIPKVHLKCAIHFLISAARKLGTTEYSRQIDDEVDNFIEVTNIMLLNLTGIYSDQSKKMKQVEIYQHMGYCLWDLFDLLLKCDKEHLYLQKFIHNIIRTCCSIVRNVSINVFCAWAEIEEEGESLQRLIAEKAYLIIETFHKYNGAGELISMLGGIAKKPLSVTEMVQKSDMSFIIKMVNRTDNNQVKWFRALFTTQVFRNKEALDCIDHWAHLCNEEDVTHLLNLSIQANSEDFHKLVIKCATCLDSDKLLLVCTRHFYRNKFSHVLNANIEPSLTLMFNKLSENQFQLKDLAKEIVVLLLQNPMVVFTFIKYECIRNKFYTDCLMEIFNQIKEISKIDNIGIISMKEALNKNTLNCQNGANCAYLFGKMLEIEYFTKEDIMLKILLPFLKQYYDEKNLENLTNFLQIILDVNISIPVRSQYREFLEFFLELMKCRSKFLTYVSTNQEVVKYAVTIVCDLCEISMNSDVQENCFSEDCFMSYYSKYLSSDMKNSLFMELCPNFDINNYGSCVSQILQILPSAVTREWLNISEEIIKCYGTTKYMDIFTDVMILLSQLVETQNFEKNNSIYLALTACVNNFGIVIQQQVQKESTLEIEEMVAKQICRLIAKLPDLMKETEGLLLLNVLTERSLKSLATDKDFLCLVILIKNSNVCKTLVEKMKSTC